MKTVKSITWLLPAPAFICGIILMCIGHLWIGLLMWIVSVQKTVKYKEE